MKKLHKLLAALVVLFSGVGLYSQSGIVIHNKNIQSYPSVQYELFIYDSDDVAPKLNYDKSNLVVLDNGLIPNNIEFLNQNQNTLANASVSLHFDLAMSNNSKFGKSRFDIGKDFFKEFIKVVDSNNIEIALSSFDAINYYHQGFAHSKYKLTGIVNNFQPEGASSIDQAFIDKPGGAAEIHKTSKYAKFAVLVTDGSLFIEKNRVIKEMQDNQIRPLIMVIGKPASKDILELVAATNGYFVDEIEPSNNLGALAKYFYSLILGYTPSLLTYLDRNICNDFHNVEISLPGKSYKTTTTYKIESFKKPMLVANPTSLGFSSVLPGTFKDLDIAITAVNGNIKIKKFNIQDIRYQIVKGNIGSEIVLPENQSLNLTIRYTPSDSAITFTTLEIDAEACMGREIYLTGGFPNTPPVERTIKLLTPECKTTLVPGDTFSIRWTGLLPKDVIQLEYSINNGRTWDTLARNVQDLSYLWTVPNVQSDECLIRAIQLWPNNVGRTLDLRHLGEVNTAFFNSDGSQVITASADRSVIIWNANSGRIVHNLQGHSAEVTFADFNKKGDKAASVGKDGKLIVWDVVSGNKIMDKELGRIVHSVRFSNDDKYILVSCNDGCADVFNANDLSEVADIRAYKGGVCWYAEFSYDDKYILTTGNDGIAKVWDWKNQINNPFKQLDTRVASEVNPNEKYGNATYATFNHNYSKVAVVSLQTKRIYVFDFATGDTVYTLQHKDGIVHFSASFYYSTKYGDMLLTTSEDDVRLWDANTGTPGLPHIIKEHTKSVLTAVFNFDAKRILTASRDFTAKIWNLEQRDLQMDTTDCVFRIKPVAMDLVNIDFGDVPIFSSKDTVINNFLTNKTDFNFQIRAINIVGGENSKFQFLNDIDTPFYLDTLTPIRVKMQFRPTQPGKIFDTVNVLTSGGTYRAVLTGNGVDRGIYSYMNIVDFDEVEIGDSRDSTISLMVVNKGFFDVEIENIELQKPDTTHFRIINNPGKTILRPNQTLGLTIRYTPSAIEVNNGTVAFIYNGTLSPLKIGLLGQGTNPRIDTLTISIGNHSASPGEIVEVPIKISNISQDGIRKSVTGFRTHLRYNATLLSPLDYYPNWMDGNDRVMLLDLPRNFGPDSILAKIRFRAALGNDSLTNFKLEYSSPIGLGKLKINTQNGSFRLTGFCNEGGARLFDSEGKVYLKQTFPNPTQGLATLEFSVVEIENTKIYLIDLQGKLVKELINKELARGEYSLDIDLTDIPAGNYFCVMETPTRKFTKTLIIQR